MPGKNNGARQLHLLTPKADVFLEVLQPLWSEAKTARQIHIIGDNALANSLASAAGTQGISIERGQNLCTTEAVGPQLIIFTETDGERLSAQLLSCADMDDVIIVAPVTDWHFSQKPLFLISIPKAGTHLLHELAKALGYAEGVKLPEFPRGQTWYCVEYSNSHTRAADFFVDSVRRAPFGNRHHAFMRTPALFLFRHPLDILVSEAHYYNRDGKTAFAGWLSQLSFSERILRLVQDNWLIGSLRDRIGSFLPWMEFPNVISLSFEELVGTSGGGNKDAQLRLIWSVQLKLQVPGSPDVIAAHVFNPDSATFRSGKIGGYADDLPPEIIRKFISENTDILEHLGYDLHGAPGLPCNRDQHRRQPVAYSHVDYSNMPLLVQDDFLGCNLVQYGNRVYAVPIAAGHVALDELSTDILSELPSARSISELKSLLLIGHSGLAQNRRALDQLAGALKEKDFSRAVHRYWKEGATPQISDEYKGFNIVFYQGYYLGLRRSIGQVEISGNLAEIACRYTSGDMLISASDEQLRSDIDALLSSRRTDQQGKLLSSWGARLARTFRKIFGATK